MRRAVRSLLADGGFEVCGAATDGRDGIEKARQLKPDVITMDISVPNLNNLDATREICRVLPEVAVVIMSQHDVTDGHSSRNRGCDLIRVGAFLPVGPDRGNHIVVFIARLNRLVGIASPGHRRADQLRIRASGDGGPIDIVTGDAGRCAGRPAQLHESR